MLLNTKHTAHSEMHAFRLLHSPVDRPTFLLLPSVCPCRAPVALSATLCTAAHFDGRVRREEARRIRDYDRMHMDINVSSNVLNNNKFVFINRFRVGAEQSNKSLLVLCALAVECTVIHVVHTTHDTLDAIKRQQRQQQQQHQQ